MGNDQSDETGHLGEVLGHQPFLAFFRCPAERSGEGSTGVVDQDVDLPAGHHHVVDETGHRIAVPDVEDPPQGDRPIDLPVRRVFERVEAVGLHPVAEGHGGAAMGQDPCRRLADALGRAGDDGHPAVEPERVVARYH